MCSQYNCYITNLDSIDDPNETTLFLSKRRRSSSDTISSVSSRSTFFSKHFDNEESSIDYYDDDESLYYDDEDDEESLYYEEEEDDHDEEDEPSLLSLHNDEKAWPSRESHVFVSLDTLIHECQIIEKHKESDAREELDDTTVGSCDFGDSVFSDEQQEQSVTLCSKTASNEDCGHDRASPVHRIVIET